MYKFRILTITLAIALAAGAGLTACSDEPGRDASSATRLPPEAIGALDVGPRGLSAPPNATMQVIFFDKNGRRVGAALQGAPISGPQIVSNKNRLIAGTGKSIISVSSSGSSSIPIDETLAGGAATDPVSGGSI